MSYKYTDKQQTLRDVRVHQNKYFLFSKHVSENNKKYNFFVLYFCVSHLVFGKTKNTAQI